MNKQELKEAVSEALHEKRSITDEIHRDDHEFIGEVREFVKEAAPYIEAQVKKEKRRDEIWQTVKKAIAVWGSIAILTYIFWAVAAKLGINPNDVNHK